MKSPFQLIQFIKQSDCLIIFGFIHRNKIWFYSILRKNRFLNFLAILVTLCTFEALCIDGGENFKRGITIERELRVSVANEIVGRLPKTSDTLPFVDLNVADNRGDINGGISSLREMGLLITGRRILVTVFQDPSRKVYRFSSR